MAGAGLRVRERADHRRQGSRRLLAPDGRRQLGEAGQKLEVLKQKLEALNRLKG
jgi:hypothetical protein